MKSKIIRLTAASVITGLIAITAPLSAAYAATVPVAPTTTDAPVWVLDGNTYAEFTDKSTEVAWDYDGNVYLSAVPADTFEGDTGIYKLAAPPSGADHWRTFIATPGQERTRSAWGSWGDPITFLNGKGPIMPQITPVYQSFGTPANIKSTGGTYSAGVAYLDSLDNTVVSAYYTTINVDAGTGNWKFATPAAPVVVTDVVTTTALAANPTTVDAGSTTSLTATVTASKAVTGNVEFYKGSTKIGSQGLASGKASLTVTIGTAGTHSYSAKFVENTVGSDKFLGSTSADVTVTGVVPAVALPPNAPTESALNVNTANGATASYDATTHKATLTVDAANNGKTVNAFAYSTPTYLGQLVVTGNTISGDVSTLAAGVHKLAIVDPTTGDVLAWASFTKSDAAIAPSISKTINADVAGQTLADGEFSLTNLSGDTVNLTNPALVNGASVVSGTLGNFKVTDLRQASAPGWTLKTDVTDFAKGSDTIDKKALGIAPVVVSQAGSGATAPTLGTAQVSGSASYPWNFAELAGTKFSGVSTYNADLVFTAPQGKPAGTYNSTLTLTLISK